MAVTEQKPQEKEEAEEDKEELPVLDSNHIISDAYRSQDRQIKELDKIPEVVKGKANNIIKLLYSECDIFLKIQGQLAFIECMTDLSDEIGNALHAILEIELAKQKVKTETPVIMPMPTQTVTPNPQVVLQQTPPKGGGWADYFGVRRWATTMERLGAIQQTSQMPQSTTSKVIDILDYGRELVAQYNSVYDFWSKGIDHLYFFNDVDTHERQHKQLAVHLVKIVTIIRSFSKTIVEYRKERFGDRKASVASGVLWLEGAKARMIMPMGFGSQITPTSQGATSQTLPKKFKGGPFPAEMSSSVGDE